MRYWHYRFGGPGIQKRQGNTPPKICRLCGMLVRPPEVAQFAPLAPYCAVHWAVLSVNLSGSQNHALEKASTRTQPATSANLRIWMIQLTMTYNRLSIMIHICACCAVVLLSVSSCERLGSDHVAVHSMHVRTFRSQLKRNAHGMRVHSA